jgi:uncharacterized protein YndB with AHSA1/START domain
MTRQHEHAINLPASPARIFALLHTPSDICAWWSAASAIVLPQTKGVWAAVWGQADDPDYLSAATIAVFDPPRRLVLTDFKYFAKTGPLPFQASLSTEFTVTPHEAGTVLRVLDSVADEFYAACEKGWHDTFESIHRYLTSKPD